MKITKIIVAVALSIAIFSCSKKEEVKDDFKFSADEAGINAKIDVSNDDVSNIVEEQFEATNANSTSGKSVETSTSFFNLHACATVTRVPDFGTVVPVGNEVKKTIDFGTVGCPMPNGNILRGTIVIKFTFNPSATSHTINYEFVNFYHNAIKLNGNKTFTRTMSVATTNSPSHPIVVMTMDLSATFPDGRVFTRVGTRTREIVEGFSTPQILADNIYKITGNWTTTFPSTTVQTSTITTPLLVKMSCMAVNKPLIVQGVISFVRNSQTATLDYGSGQCDNIAIFTHNGISYTIIIGN